MGYTTMTEKPDIGADLSAFLQDSVEAVEKYNTAPKSERKPPSDPTNFPYHSLWEKLSSMGRATTQGEIKRLAKAFSKQKDKKIPDDASMERQIMREVALFNTALSPKFFTQREDKKTYFFLPEEGQKTYKEVTGRWGSIAGLVLLKQYQVSTRFFETALNEIVEGKQRKFAKQALLSTITSNNYSQFPLSKNRIRSLWEKVYLPIVEQLSESNTKEQYLAVREAYNNKYAEWFSTINKKKPAPTPPEEPSTTEET